MCNKSLAKNKAGRALHEVLNIKNIEKVSECAISAKVRPRSPSDIVNKRRPGQNPTMEG